MIETSVAYAKINISLDIVSKMDNGFHHMKMVMQTISLCDEIHLECIPGEGISIDAGKPYLPRDDRNIAIKAANAFFNHTGITGYRTFIKIKKDIPACAGLGGGSADGACVLRMLDKMFQTGLGRKKLEEIGGTIGSDVPFCIAGGTSLAEGKGDVLTDLPQMPDCYIVICKPTFSCSTPELFGRMKCDKIRARPDTAGLIGSLGTGDIGGVARRMYNVFEDVLPHGKQDVDEIKSVMLDNGALGAVMTGSGPAVFGLFDDLVKAENAYGSLKPIFKECHVTQPAARLTI